MALPTTITGIRTTASCSGPFISSAGNVYFIGADSVSNIVSAQKATDPTSSFSVVGTGPINTNGGQSSRKDTQFGVYQVGDVLHCLGASDGGTTIGLKYANFDMSTDTWSSAEVILAAGTDTTTNAGVVQCGNSIVVRSGSNGDGSAPCVAFFNGVHVTSMGATYAQTYYSRRTAVNTWSAPVQVSAGGTADNIVPEAVLDGTSDRVYFSWGDSVNGWQVRALSTANVLQTSQQVSTITGTGLERCGLSYNNAGTAKAVVFYNSSSVGGGANFQNAYFNGADVPTINSNNSATNATSLPIGLFNDGTDVWAVFRKNTGSTDLWAVKSTDNGATWGTAVDIFTATVTNAAAALSIDGNIFTRGSSVVIPYVVNDNGTLKYNEYVVRTIAAAVNPKIFQYNQAVKRSAFW